MQFIPGAILKKADYSGEVNIPNRPTSESIISDNVLAVCFVDVVFLWFPQRDSTVRTFCHRLYDVPVAKHHRRRGNTIQI